MSFYLSFILSIYLCFHLPFYLSFNQFFNLSTYINRNFFREWAELTDEQQKYLVQVRSPGDTFQYIVRDLAFVTNISNAAILFDDTFGK